MVIALENVRSLYNVGAILRTAAFFDVKQVLLVGYTGRTKAGVDRLHPKVLKTALQADQDLQITFLATSQALVAWAKKQKRSLVAIEQSPQAIPLNQWQPDQRTVLVLGNEVDGVSSTILAVANKIVEIPRLGKKSSLNVAIAAGIIMTKARL